MCNYIAGVPPPPHPCLFFDVHKLSDLAARWRRSLTETLWISRSQSLYQYG
jgi:hypothetical protein